MHHSPQTTSAQTSAQAFGAVGLSNLKKLQDKILDICIAAQRNGARDLSGREIQQRYEQHFSLAQGYAVRIEMSSVSSRVNALVSAGRLERVEVARACAVTGSNILPVRVPMTQASLVA
ncbi:hypothetical protein [Rhodoferax ferrireducens]|uniref:hypothetical protein n=1 Tax=Rhodoferax ferrireducens TaxID=192843 RepID=UPI000E0D8054|nr:hypothetical protein [Rhodoferax ferrireducens]